MSGSSKQTEQEPSIEEILSSIRQIISDDEDEDAKPDVVEDVVDPEPEEEPIVLTQRVDPDPVPDFSNFLEDDEDEQSGSTPPVQIDMRDAEAEDDFSVDFDSSLDDEPEPVVEPDPVPAPSVKSSRPEPSYDEPSADDEDSLLTKRAEDAAYGAFKKLAVKTAVDNISSITLEEIVRDELRPMLRVWLDENLPNLVERLVKEELDRVARRALED